MARFDNEHRQKLRLAQLGKTKPQEIKDKIGKSCKNVLSNPEIKAKMSKAAFNQPVKICPHCGKEGKANAMYRWHFDNCKKSVDIG